MTSSVPLASLSVGDIIYANVVINQADMADPNSKSTTAKKIKKGQPVERICIVLAVHGGSVDVTYTATFAKSTQLPTSFTDKSYWYPINPATKEGTLDPIPSAINPQTAQWASLRQTQKVTANPAKRIDGSQYTAASVALILAAMKA